MSYAQSVLQPGETIVAEGRLHWTIYGWAILFLLIGIVVVWLEYRYLPPQQAWLMGWTAATFGAAVVASFVYAWFIRWITEFAITNRRVIFKKGFVWRNTAEMNMDKIETVDVLQSIPGRLLGYGTIRILGTGASGGIEVRRIASPIELRNAITAK
jgi:uncharacterized membrane protein YdbT with pleckstrin-like domain